MAVETKNVQINSADWTALTDGSTQTSGVVQVPGSSRMAISVGTAKPSAVPSSTFKDYQVYTSAKDFPFAGLNTGEQVWAISMDDAAMDVRVIRG